MCLQLESIFPPSKQRCNKDKARCSQNPVTDLVEAVNSSDGLGQWNALQVVRVATALEPLLSIKSLLSLLHISSKYDLLQNLNTHTVPCTPTET